VATCVPLNTNGNCGACGVTCSTPENPICNDVEGNGTYACAAEETCDTENFRLVCDGTCVDSSKNGNCGECGKSCDAEEVCYVSEDPSTYICQAGSVCTDLGLGACNGQCVDLSKNGNCGACGTTCGAGQVCNDSDDDGTSSCEAASTCEGPEEGVCQGNCVDFTQSGNCGACGATCEEDEACEANGETGLYSCVVVTVP
jgi:hypothetical protein